MFFLRGRFFFLPRNFILHTVTWSRCRGSVVACLCCRVPTLLERKYIVVRDTSRKSEKHWLIRVVSLTNPCCISESTLHFIFFLTVLLRRKFVLMSQCQEILQRCLSRTAGDDRWCCRRVAGRQPARQPARAAAPAPTNRFDASPAVPAERIAAHHQTRLSAAAALALCTCCWSDTNQCH